jgi:hypothetical protein
MPLGAFRLNSLGKATITVVAEVIRAKKSISAIGNAQISTAQSQFGGSSALFDGNGDWLQTASIPDFGFGTGDFTLEAWIRTTTALTFQVIVNARQGYDGLFGNVLVLADGKVSWSDGVAFRQGTTVISSNVWYHCAVSRSSGVVKIFLNGVAEYDQPNTANVGTGNRFISIGAWPNEAMFNGHIDEVRISKTARYTSNFTPSTTPFTADDNTVLLLHMDGTNKSPFFVDDNGVRLAKRLSATGNAQISTAQSQFGGSSALFDGNGDYLSVSPSNDFQFTSTSSWTIECWVRTTAVNNSAHIIGYYNVSSPFQGYGFRVSFTNSCLAFWDGVAWREFNTSSLATNTWYHAAVVSDGGSCKMYLNGTQQTTTFTATSSIAHNASNFIVGARQDGAASFTGNLDEFRVSNTARYTSNFTPSTTPFVNDANTLLLIHADGANASTVFQDDNGVRSPKGILAHAQAQISTAQSQFGGSSALFDGTGDYLGIYNNTDFIFGTGNFTVEYWVRPTLQGACVHFDTRRLGFSNDTAITLYYTPGSQLTFYSNGAVRITGGALASNTWHHIALVRTGDDHKLYINGTQSGSTFTASYNILVAASACTVGGASDAIGNLSTPGYIDEFRVSNTARYTSNFTPPTAPFVNDANTLLLLHMDGGNGSREFFDDAPGTLSAVTEMLPVDAVTSTASTITIPSWALADDYAVLFDYSTTTTLTIPSGWTGFSIFTTGIRSTISYKKLVSGDINTTITGMGGTTRKVLVIVRGNAPISSITVSTPAQQATTAIPTNQTISMSGSIAPVMGFAHYTSTGAVATRTGVGNIREFTSTSNQFVKVWAYTPTQSTNITVGQSDNGTNALQSFWIRFNP